MLIDIMPVLCTGFLICIKYSIMNKGGIYVTFCKNVGLWK
ncbi:hypothetical protein ACQ29_gp293 [Escherichia phage PBECO4]|uniref:Uncharacterized protein n=1 Tax=Escherichia phage PBECO4 TaxID=1273738 RepID=L7TLH8_9CAUD|nr:hypothetical protein ACQ29_gp293 [Escherichia phage PBECO4]AGC34973.1 hypothetical protein [Escherichia phage PBECO4]